MPFYNMFHDGKAKARSARFPAARRIDSIEALGQARQMVGGNAIALIANGELHPRSIGPHRYLDRPRNVVAAVTDRIADEIVGKLQ